MWRAASGSAWATSVIRAAIESAAPGSTHEAVKRRDEDQRWGMPTAIVPVDETPEEVAARLLGKSG
jgi:ADP-ribose pyrophosphatase YjhB (NUDIX family)